MLLFQTWPQLFMAWWKRWFSAWEKWFLDIILPHTKPTQRHPAACAFTTKDRKTFNNFQSRLLHKTLQNSLTISTYHRQFIYFILWGTLISDQDVESYQDISHIAEQLEEEYICSYFRLLRNRICQRLAQVSSENKLISELCLVRYRM